MAIGDVDAWWIVTVVLTIAGMVLNCIMIHILRQNQKKKAYETFLLSFSIGELMMVPSQVTITIYMVISTIHDFSTLLIILIAITSLGLFSRLLSLHHLIAISADRLWAVASPLAHRVHVTGRKVTAVVVFCWLCPLLITVAYIAHVITTKLDTLVLKILASGIIVTDVMFIICYGTIIVTVYRKKRSLGNTLDYQLKVFRLCVGTVMIFVISSTPFVVVYITEWNRPSWLVQLSGAMLPVNSIATSFLFLYQNHQSKRHNSNAATQTAHETDNTTKV